LDDETLSQYIAVLENGGELPPITLFRDDAGQLYLADGFHRFRAHEETHERMGKETIKAYIKDGNRDAAIEFAESANLEHGLKLTHEDKKSILYRRIERGHEWANWSTRELGRVLGVGHNTVKRWLDEHQATVPNGTVKRTETIGADGRVYNTSNIGKSPRKANDDGYVPLTPEQRQEMSEQAKHISYESIDTGNGSASVILSDELAARRREGQVREAIKTICEGVVMLLENRNVEIMGETELANRMDLIAALVDGIEHSLKLIRQINGTLPNLENLKYVEGRLGSVDDIFWNVANELKDRIGGA
jgi:tetrahydromethanopterin S-methyltransferase subunit B